ncbi:MAG: copper resistance protein NlpE N-terminal domain-containing protein [Pseudomonadales bacterium]|nr:copper resistance protein NlpE N-terminal domain-containing protein [Pseudomonadales bacterium]
MYPLARIALPLMLGIALGGCSGERGTESGEPEVSTQPDAPTETLAQPASQPARPDGHSSRDALDWAGTYSGVLPCASCPGIETTVTLNQDGTYQRSMVFIDENPEPFVSSGTFAWDTDGRAVMLEAEGDEAQQYQVGENVLFHLDRDGRRIEGDLAARYLLHKHANDPQVEDRRWTLVELRGQPVDPAATGGTPFLILDSEHARASGNASCNTFNGPYRIKTGSRIEFHRHMATTMMACPDMDREAAFLEMLTMVDNYSVGEDGGLSLNRARMAPLARFVEMPVTE